MQSGGCSVGCGTSSVFGNYTSVSSHGLTEAITDADVGIATVFSPPLAWYDMADNAEIGDLCNGQQGSYVANGTTYTIPLEFSKAANNCVLPPPAPNATFPLSASPASLTVTQGNSGNSTVTVTPSGGFTGSVTLSASGLPSGVTATFGTNPTTSTSVLTLSASSTATTGTATVTITGTSGSLTSSTTVSLAVRVIPTLPSVWSDGDIGATGVAGSAGYENNIFTVQGAGTQIYGTADAFHFVYQALSGDGSIGARLVSLQGGSGSVSAGVM